MSYFNFKLYTRPVKNVNTDLEFKKGNWAPGYPTKGGRAPILGYRKTVDCSGPTGCQNETIYKDNWAKTCAVNSAVCYNPVIRRIQNGGGKIDNKYNYNTHNLLRSRFKTYEQNAYNFDLSGNLTNWSGGADPANNAYLIHDCSCNVPFTANNPCIATYAPSNRQFAVNTAVSGRSRINRLKYNTRKRVAVTKKVPFGLLSYPKGSCEFCKRDFKPSNGKEGGDAKNRINSRLGILFEGYSKLRINGLTTVANNFFYQSGNDNATPPNSQSNTTVYCYIWVDSANTTPADGRANSATVRVGSWAIGWTAGATSVIANFIRQFLGYEITGNYKSVNWIITDTNPSSDYIEIQLKDGSKFKGDEVVQVWNDYLTNNNPEYVYDGRPSDGPPLPGPGGIFAPWTGFITFIV